MSPLRLLLLLVVALAAGLMVSPSSAGPPVPTKGKQDSKQLFDGKTLDGWKSADYSGEGKIKVQDGALILEKGKVMTGVVYSRGDFPKMDYEVTLEGKRIAGSDFFCTTTFPVGETFCSLVAGGWGGSTVGISSINGSDASENETNTSHDFEDNRWYTFRIRVTKKRLEAWIDRDKAVDLDTTDRRLTTRIECDSCQPFGIATYQTTAAVRNIRVRSLTDAEKKASAETKPEKKHEATILPGDFAWSAD